MSQLAIQAPRVQAEFEIARMRRLRAIRDMEAKSLTALTKEQLQWWAENSTEAFWYPYYSDAVKKAQERPTHAWAYITISRYALRILEAIRQPSEISAIEFLSEPSRPEPQPQPRSKSKPRKSRQVELV